LTMTVLFLRIFTRVFGSAHTGDAAFSSALQS
jgi:hypothetical protein